MLSRCGQIDFLLGGSDFLLFLMDELLQIFKASFQGLRFLLRFFGCGFFQVGFFFSLHQLFIDSLGFIFVTPFLFVFFRSGVFARTFVVLLGL